MKRDDEGIRIMQDLLAAQPLGVLATSMAGQPYTSLVAFVADADLRQVWFATERATRKYQLVQRFQGVREFVFDATPQG
jgi:hypothetical protein